MSNPCPTIPDALMKWLDEMYPERSPEPSMSPAEMWMRAGERRLVRTLLSRHKDQGPNPHADQSQLPHRTA